GKCDRLHETGIIGSMRWWYEAIVRGLGGYACDPSSGSCKYDSKEGLANICLACQIFGCTGYSRRFRLVAGDTSNLGQLIEVKLNKPERSDHRGWRVPVNLVDSITLSVLPMHEDGLQDFEITALYYTIRLIEQYGALGAKTSHGQGVIKVSDWGNLVAKMSVDAWYEELKRRPAKKDNYAAGIPSLKNFIGFTVVIDNSDINASDLWDVMQLKASKLNRQAWKINKDDMWIPSAPAFRAILRSWLRNSDNTPRFTGNLNHERHRLMGTTQRDPNSGQPRDRPKGSDIFVTHFYKIDYRWTMRVFGFVSSNGNEVDMAVRSLLLDQDELKTELRQVLGNLPVRIMPYPVDVKALLSMVQGERQ
ncbi:type III-B CRISPR module RAMP protein Cmr1, partial [Candidatus Aquicultor secundus]|uniref:type III-B CRISPR module RAMP protein Cmr1 n=2 Tax=Candidatus Aquicultor secundus TaxID=1973895 RepID=UPI000CA7C7DC